MPAKSRSSFKSKFSADKSSSSSMWSTASSARLIFLLAIGCGIVGFWQMHSATTKSMRSIGDLSDHGKDKFISGSPRQRINEQETEKILTKMTSNIEKLNQQVEEDHKNLELTRNALREFLGQSQAKFDAVVKQIADLDQPSRSLKVHFWDDSTNFSPREDILVSEGWLEYNGKALGETDDSLTPPLFVRTNDPWEADFIVWITVMARHELEKSPLDPLKHAHKAIVLDYSDGCTVHTNRDPMRWKKTELAYFKRSYVNRGENNFFKGNCTRPDQEVLPYSYSGAKAMMIPLDSPEANVNFEAVRYDEGLVYGEIAKSTNNYNNNKQNNGYFQDQRYENFLVPFRDRKWTVTNVLRQSTESQGSHKNRARNHAILWTHELSKEKAGDPRTEREVREQLKSSLSDSTNEIRNFTAYIGGIDNMCEGHCFGPNYFRHLRDAKIIVSCNPSGWEGDFRLWESFLSGAMVMVDKMVIPEFMPNPLQNLKHWVVYDPSDKADFMAKLAYYSDPANVAEAEAIAHNGYEFVLRHHMAVNRVDYVLNHAHVQNALTKHVKDPSKRAILNLPPK